MPKAQVIQGLRHRLTGGDSPKQPIAREKEYEIRPAHKDGVPINESVQKERRGAGRAGLTQYKFPWEA